LVSSFAHLEWGKTIETFHSMVHANMLFLDTGRASCAESCYQQSKDSAITQLVAPTNRTVLDGPIVVYLFIQDFDIAV
jgi:hypothetical protein